MIALPIVFLSGIIGYLLENKQNQKHEYTQMLDKSRSNFYELQAAKYALEKAHRDIVEITELNERNRIARSIHDNLGHKLVGIKMLLEASIAVKGQDEHQSEHLVKRTVSELAESIDLLRDTVYDLKPNKDVGLRNIKHIIKRFHFCQINLETKGDLNTIDGGLFAIIEQNLKEGLTNISKYSNANQVKVLIETNKKYTRFAIEDNGSNIDFIQEGLGLSGIRERVENRNGTFSIDTREGFKIYSFFSKER